MRPVGYHHEQAGGRPVDAATNSSGATLPPGAHEEAQLPSLPTKGGSHREAWDFLPAH